MLTASNAAMSEYSFGGGGAGGGGGNNPRDTKLPATADRPFKSYRGSNPFPTGMFSSSNIGQVPLPIDTYTGLGTSASTADSTSSVATSSNLDFKYSKTIGGLPTQGVSEAMFMGSGLNLLESSQAGKLTLSGSGLASAATSSTAAFNDSLVAYTMAHVSQQLSGGGGGGGGPLPPLQSFQQQQQPRQTTEQSLAVLQALSRVPQSQGLPHPDSRLVGTPQQQQQLQSVPGSLQRQNLSALLPPHQPRLPDVKPSASMTSQDVNDNIMAPGGSTDHVSMEEGEEEEGQSHLPPKKRPSNVPEENESENQYWEKRKKNNESAKRSRDARRTKEEQIAVRVVYLEQENLRLRTEVSLLKSDIDKLRCMLYNG